MSVLAQLIFKYLRFCYRCYPGRSWGSGGVGGEAGDGAWQEGFGARRDVIVSIWRCLGGIVLYDGFLEELAVLTLFIN